MLATEIGGLIDAALDRAVTCLRGGDAAAAASLCRQVLRVDRSTAALEVGSLALSRCGDHEGASTWAREAVAADPSCHRHHNNLGLVLGAAGDRGGAAAAFRRAIELAPGLPFLRTNLALELRKYDVEEALEVFADAARRHPGCEHVHFNYGAVAHEVGLVAMAAGLYERALQIRADFPACRYNLSACRFQMGDYERAWPDYEARWEQFPHFARVRARFAAPYWGGEALHGKTLVLYCEQGLGDLVMGARFARDVKELGATVVLECPAVAAELLSTCDGVDDVVDEYVGEPDYHCSLLTVPGVVGVRPWDRPPGAYLKSPATPSAGWDRYRPRRLVGICWTGNPTHPNDRNRSCPLAKFAALASEDVQLFGLQRDARPHVYPGTGVVDWCAGGEDVRFVDLSEHMGDLTCTAGLLSALDEVVTVDTCVAHLAGALGRPVTTLLPYMPDWRWGLSGTATHWYGTMRLARQARAGDWGSAFAAMGTGNG